MNYFGGQETPTFDKSKWHYGRYAEKKPLAIQIDLSKVTVHGKPMNNRSLFPRRSARSVPLEWVRQQNEFPKVRLSVEPKKLTPDDLLREAIKDDPITEMVKLMTQRYNVEQSIKKLLPKMTKDEVTEVYHTLYRIAQEVNEREEQK